MRNAKQLLKEYNDFFFRDPQAAAEIFTDDGAFEMFRSRDNGDRV